jgi:NAD(P)-dependent dehydrogenase (short-subunit alcohol dehydrogenase family)
MPKLDDKLIVVTGALGVLGSVVANMAEAAGARVAHVDHAEGKAPGPLVFCGVDLTDEAETTRVMAEIAKSGEGKIDGLVNVAGGFVWQTLEDGGAPTWEHMFRMNLLTAVNASRAARSSLTAAKGAIVNIGANAAGRAAAGMGAYAAAKSGVLRLTESLAEELASAGVRVNAVMPSIIDTPANRRDLPDANVKTWVLPEDIAKVILFLLSGEAQAVTGAAIPVTNPRRG